MGIWKPLMEERLWQLEWGSAFQSPLEIFWGGIFLGAAELSEEDEGEN